LAHVLACATQKPAPEKKDPLPAKFGGQVVSVPAKGLPLVAFRIAFQAGSIDDPPFKDGITALAAELMAKGGTKDLSSAELLEALFPMAAGIDAQTDKELTVFSGEVHRDHVARYLPLLVAAIATPRWDVKEFARLRDDALQDIEKRLRTSDDENLGKAALDALLYAGHPYAHYAGGSVSGLKAIGLEDVKAHAAQVFTQDRMLIGLAGAVDDALTDGLKRGLSALPGKGAELRVLPKPVDKGPKVLLVAKEASSVAVSMGYPYELGRGHPDFHAFLVAGSALGEHRQFIGRLMRELRGKRGLNYGDYAYVEHFAQEGWSTLPRPNVSRRQQDFTVWLRPVVTENSLFALRAAQYVLDRYATEGITQDELDTVKGFLKGYTLLFRQTPMQRLGHAIDDIFYGTRDHWGTFRKSLDTLSRDDVNRAIKKYLVPGKLRLAVVVKDAEGMKQALLKGAPSSITYPAETPDPAVVAEDQKFVGRPFGLGAGDIEVRPASALFEQ
jgi:zinc protease